MISPNLIDEIYPMLRELVVNVRFNSDLMNVFSEIWDVYQKPSTGEDYRYKILGDEIEKHFIMNNDWSEDKLLLSVLKIKNEGDSFLRFLEHIINYEKNKNERDDVIKKIKTLLEKERFALVSSQDGHLKIQLTNNNTFQVDNPRPFIRCKSTILSYKNFTEEDIEWPDMTDCYVLTFNDQWNDFSFYTWFGLYYIDNNGKQHNIGSVKIIKRGCPNTDECLEQKFYSLPEDFCSLGFDVSYYQEMKKVLGEKAYTCLAALRDAACFSNIHESFERESAFEKSLCRFNVSEKALREGRYHVNGRNMDDAYAFAFKFQPRYADHNDKMIINFRFAYKCQPYKRIIGLIGENGVGKTTLINEIVGALINGNKELFDGLKPLFSQVIIVSYSPFDQFLPSGTDYTIGYKYCGLLKGKDELFSMQEQVDNLIENIQKIKEREASDVLMTIWENIMSEVFPREVIRSIYHDNDIDKDATLEICQKMSSGETMFMFSISDIIANIRKDTLLFFDEPEQHLHPHAISQLLMAIFMILEKFESYAIVATHSALVIREMVSENVLIFNRDFNALTVNKIGIECFGEDISIISDVIFKNMNDTKRYEKYIEDTAKRCDWDYKKTIEQLQLNEKISLNVRLLINSIIDQNRN